MHVLNNIHHIMRHHRYEDHFPVHSEVIPSLKTEDKRELAARGCKTLHLLLKGSCHLNAS